jgi:ATP-dependent Clp protease protease subunit
MTSSRIDRLHDRLLERRIIVLGDEVTDESAERVVSQLLVLSAEDPSADISLHINSPGGSVMAGLGVYDIIQLIPNDVRTVAVGLAASMAQVVLCAGTPGKRYALPNAHVLMHEGSAGLGGAAADVEIQAAHLVATVDRMRSIVSRHTGQPIDRVAVDMGRDRWFDAHEALEYGFVDHIVTSLAEICPPHPPRPIGLMGEVADVVGSRSVVAS